MKKFTGEDLIVFIGHFTGPMWYLSERLLWLGEDGDVVVADTNLNNSAALDTSDLGVSHFIVMLSDLQPMPGIFQLCLQSNVS